MLLRYLNILGPDTIPLEVRGQILNVIKLFGGSPNKFKICAQRFDLILGAFFWLSQGLAPKSPNNPEL
jgi:hypothetical protein